MSGNVIVLLELLLVFGLVIGWGLHELHSLKRSARGRDDQHDPPGTHRD